MITLILITCYENVGREEGEERVVIDTGHRVDELVLRVVFRVDVFIIANEVQLEGVGGAARQRCRFVFNDEGVLRFLEEERCRTVRPPRRQRVHQ